MVRYENSFLYFFIAQLYFQVRSYFSKLGQFIEPIRTEETELYEEY